MPTTLSREQARAWFALLRAPGLGAGGLRALIARCGDAVSALDQVRTTNDISPAARAWLSAPDEALLAADADWLAQRNHHLIVYPDPDYPVLLRSAQNPPAALLVAGDPATMWSPQIAIVGARSASAAGLANARAFARAFAQAGNVVTSGLAEGVDAAAHEGALEGGGNTLAVLGTGPDLVYPRQHRDLAERIIAHGALVSEFPPGTPGKPEHFPRRNRLIAALSLGTLVIEAGLKSGSLITARLAVEQGREVFALPGSIHSPLARGCHKLIRDGAKLVETAEEVIEELRGVGGLLAEGLRARLHDDAPQPSSQSRASSHAGDPDYTRLFAALSDGALALDELVVRSGLSAAALSSMLLVLELDGAVVAENGRYSRR